MDEIAICGRSVIATTSRASEVAVLSFLFFLEAIHCVWFVNLFRGWSQLRLRWFDDRQLYTAMHSQKMWHVKCHVAQPNSCVSFVCNLASYYLLPSPSWNYSHIPNPTMAPGKRGKKKVGLLSIRFLPMRVDLTTSEYKTSAHWLPTNQIRAA